MKQKILTFGELLIRFTPTEQYTWGDSLQMKAFYGGSEANVVATLSNLGLKTKLISALPNNNIGESIFKYFTQQQIEMDEVVRIGQKVGIYYANRSFGVRPGEVIYDRQNSSFTELNSKMLDLERIFNGITWFHFSGITAAINEQTRGLLTEILSYAKEKGVMISMDLNYRSKMWDFNMAKDVMSNFAQYVDICFGIEPLVLTMGETFVFDMVHGSEMAIEQRMKALQKHYKFKYIFHTKRSISVTNINTFQAYVLSETTFEASEKTQTQLFERIGSGDAFVSGAIYGIISNFTEKKLLNLACKFSNLKCTLEGDHLRLTKSEIENLLTENIFLR